MHQRYALCTIGLFFSYLGLCAWGLFEQHITISDEWFSPPPDASAETLLAMGEKLPYPCADMSALLLIPGISDKSAAALIEKREKVLSYAAAAPPGDVRAFTLVHGIGEKRAEILGRYLSFDEREIEGGCRVYMPFEPTPQSHSSPDFAGDPHQSR